MSNPMLDFTKAKYDEGVAVAYAGATHNLVEGLAAAMSLSLSYLSAHDMRHAQGVLEGARVVARGCLGLLPESER